MEYILFNFGLTSKRSLCIYQSLFARKEVGFIHMTNLMCLWNNLAQLACWKGININIWLLRYTVLVTRYLVFIQLTRLVVESPCPCAFNKLLILDESWWEVHEVQSPVSELNIGIGFMNRLVVLLWFCFKVNDKITFLLCSSDILFSNFLNYVILNHFVCVFCHSNQSKLLKQLSPRF